MDNNIQVGIRIRPIIIRELQNHQKVIWKTERNRIYSQNKQHSYEFDKVFDQSTKTKEIYDILGKPIVEKVMEGFNGTLFAYGQTASGKTHTIMGDTKSELGIIPLAIKDVFNHIEQSPNREFLMRASYLEIYNEEITDLVTNTKDSIKIRSIKENAIVVENITEESIISYEQTMEFINNGKRNRMIGKTNMNERSSRSHVIFRLVIESRALPNEFNKSAFDGAVIVSELNLVDLAGSERAAQTGAQGARLKESGYINTSLMTLGLVIRKLSEGDSHVPYRDSKLTRILQNSLGGNARTSIICTVSPVVLDESVQTLKFAGRAKNVTNNPTINEVLDGDTKMRRQMNEIRDLKRKIRDLEGGEMPIEMLQEQDKMLAEKQMYRRKIEEQEAKIAKLLTEIVCSGRQKFEESKLRASRRQTWCPGGLSTLRKLANIEDDEKDAITLTKKDRITERRSDSLSSMRLETEKHEHTMKETIDDSFEKHEYQILKEEFDDYKLEMSKELEDLRSTLTDTKLECQRCNDQLVDKETEYERCKNKLKDKEAECVRLRDMNDMGQWPEALDTAMEQKCEENQELKTRIKELESKVAGQLNAGELQSIQEQNVSLETEKEQYEAKIREYVSAMEDLNNQFNEFKRTNTIAQNEMFMKDEKINFLQIKLSSMESTKRDLELQIDGLKEELVQRVERPAQDEENAQKDERIIQLEEEHEEFQSVYNAKKEELQQLHERYDELENDKIQYENKASEYDRSMQELTNQLNELKKMEATSQSALSTKNEEIESLQIELQTVVSANKELQVEKDSFRVEMTKLVEERPAHSADGNQGIEQLEKEQKEFQNIFNVEKEKGQEWQERNLQLESETEQRDATIKELSNKIDELQQLGMAAEKEVLSKQEEIELLENELKTVAGANKELQLERDHLKEIVQLGPVHSGDEVKDERISQLEKENEEFQTAYNTEKEKCRQLQERNDTHVNESEQYETKIKENLQSMKDLAAQINEFKKMEKLTKDGFSSKNEQIESLQRELNVLNNTNKELQSETDRLMEENAQLIKNKSTAVHDENDEVKDRRISELEKECEELGSVYNTEKEKLQLLQEKYEAKMKHNENSDHKLQQENDRLKEELVQLMERTAQNDEQKDERIIQLEEEQGEFQNVYNAEKEKVQKLQEEYSQLESEKHLNEAELKQHLQSIENLTNQLNGFKEADTVAQNELSKKIEEIKSLHDKLDEVVSANKEMQFEADRLKQELSDGPSHSNEDMLKDERIAQLEKEHKEFQSIYNVEKEKLQKSEEKYYILESEKEKCEKKADERLSSIEELTNQINEFKAMETIVQNEISSKSAEIKSLQSEMNALVNANKELQLEADRLKEELSDRPARSDDDENNKNKQRILELEEAYGESQRKYIEKEENLQQFQEKCVGLESENQLKESKLDEYKDMDTRAQEQINTLQSELNALVNEKKELRLETDRLKDELAQMIVNSPDDDDDDNDGKDEQILQLKKENEEFQSLYNMEKEKHLCAEEKRVLAEHKNETLQIEKSRLVAEQSGFVSNINYLEEVLAEKKMSLELKGEEAKETEIKFSKIISEGKEKLQQLQDEKNDLIESNENLSEQVQSIESAIHNANTLIAEKNDDLLSKTKQLDEMSDLNTELSSQNKELRSGLEDEHDATAKLRVEIRALCDKLSAERVACEEEKSLCKSAYDRECQQNKAQVEELIVCLKNVQVENKTLNQANEQLKVELNEFESQLRTNMVTLQKNDSNEHLLTSMKLEIDTKSQEIEELTKMHTIEYDKLREEKIRVEAKLVESSKQREDIESELVELQKEVSQIKADALSGDRLPDVSSNSKTNDTSLQENVKKLQYRLSLRERDTVVYKNHIADQTEELQKLKKKLEEKNDQLRKLADHIRETRRPSGNDATAEWESTITTLDDKLLKVQYKKEEIEEINKKLKQQVKIYEENIKETKINMRQYEAMLTEQDAGQSQLKADVQKKTEELAINKNSLKKAYSRMTNAEKALQECRSEHQCKLESKDAEIQRFSDGLQTAFAKYKQYKSGYIEKETEIATLKTELSEANKRNEFLTGKLSELDTKIRSSMKNPSNRLLSQDLTFSEDLTTGQPPADLDMFRSSLLIPNRTQSISKPTNQIETNEIRTNQIIANESRTKQTNETQTLSTTAPTAANNTGKTSSTSSLDLKIFSTSFDYDKDLNLTSLEYDILSSETTKIGNNISTTAFSSKTSSDVTKFENDKPTAVLYSSVTETSVNNSTKENINVSMETNKTSSVVAKKRKSDELLEGSARRRKPLDAFEQQSGASNECNQQ